MNNLIKNPLNKLQQKDLMLLLGKSERQIRRYDDDGLPGHGEGRGRYYIWDEILPWWIAREAGSRIGGDGTMTDKERQQKADADYAEMEAAQLAGTLVVARDYQATTEALFSRLKANLMGFTPRLIDRLEGIQDQREKLAVGKREMEGTLRELSSLLDEEAS